jgi:hypothetical protein
MKWLLSLSFLIFLLQGCAAFQQPYGYEKVNIRAHWMKKGEKAPFDGVLLNEETFVRIMEKLQECKYGKK